MNHRINIYPEQFEMVIAGQKTFEDIVSRKISVGDTLTLCEYIPDKSYFTGREHTVSVEYAMTSPESDYVALAIRDIEPDIDNINPVLCRYCGTALAMPEPVNRNEYYHHVKRPYTGGDPLFRDEGWMTKFYCPGCGMELKMKWGKTREMAIYNAYSAAIRNPSTR